MVLMEENHPQRLYDKLRPLPHSSALVGWMFEVIVHQLRIRGWRGSDGTAPEPICMTLSEKAGSLTSKCSPSASPPSSEIPRPLRNHHRNATQTSLADTLDNMTLAKDEYYMPTATNNALFDSFVIDHDPSKTVRISVFHISSARDHGGSAKGYAHIKNIRDRVGTLLEKDRFGATTRVMVTYFLLCPKDEAPPGTWKMPKGWGKNSGDVFCVSVPTLGTL